MLSGLGLDIEERSLGAGKGGLKGDVEAQGELVAVGDGGTTLGRDGALAVAERAGAARGMLGDWDPSPLSGMSKSGLAGR